MLREWGVAEDRLEPALKSLLRVPQNLRLFESIAAKFGDRLVRTAYELHQAYLDEVVRRAPALGDEAMTALQRLAMRLLQERSLSVPSAAFPGSEALKRGLISAGVLIEDSAGAIFFSHQALFDNLAAQAYIAAGTDLATFLRTHPPFPFLRPAVRSFLFHLRANAPDLFRRQVWIAVSAPDIAYHLRRLIAESLAEVVPDDDDWQLINRLFRQQQDLFRRLFWRLEGEAWFRLIVGRWLPALGHTSTDQEWRVLLSSRLMQWMNSFPAEVIGLWRRALDDRWGDPGHLAWDISVQLHNFEGWSAEGVPELLEALARNQADQDLLGPAISRYVAAANRGDDLLWEYIARDVDTNKLHELRFEDSLHCAPHTFHKEEFLQERLTRSDRLLSLATSTVAEWSRLGQRWATACQLADTFLDSTSWNARHTKHEVRHVSALNMLLDGMEHALKSHTEMGSTWWREHEPGLRRDSSLALRYLLIREYQVNPESNIDGIAAQLTDAELLRYGRLEHELGELTGASYHLLPEAVQDAHQRSVLELYAEDGDSDDAAYTSRDRWRYEYLYWIPVIFRLPEVQALVERVQLRLGITQPSPRLYAWGGTVGSPIPLDNLLALKDESLFRLLRYYDGYKAHSSHPSDFGKGGRGMVEGVLRQAATHDPVRYLSLLPALETQALAAAYATQVVLGAASHLHYRFGNTQPPQDWQSVTPEPDGHRLALTLLGLLERSEALWENPRDVVHVLGACGEVLRDIDAAERMITLLFRLQHHADPAEDRQEQACREDEDSVSNVLMATAFNSVRGQAAGAATALCIQLLENDPEREPPPLLLPCTDAGRIALKRDRYLGATYDASISLWAP
jgi:hypothetical protein